jgi:ubiquinone/menaquinone biosynthesis C-methylase UbiE
MKPSCSPPDADDSKTILIRESPEEAFMTTSKPPQRTAKEQFDRQATHYDGQWSRWTEESLAWMLAHAGCTPEDEALDVATGSGFTALGFAPHVRFVTGLDVSTGMLAQARRQAAERGIANVTFVEGAAEAIPFPDAHFHLVTCRIAPHHFLSVPGFLAEVQRVLRPGGRLALADTSVPADAEADAWQNRVEALRDPSHIRNYSRAEWKRFVTEAGLTLETLDILPASIAITVNDWLVKAGCTDEQAQQVRQAIVDAPASARAAYRIESLDGDDVGLHWQRIAFIARKS